MDPIKCSYRVYSNVAIPPVVTEDLLISRRFLLKIVYHDTISEVSTSQPMVELGLLAFFTLSGTLQYMNSTSTETKLLHGAFFL